MTDSTRKTRWRKLWIGLVSVKQRDRNGVLGTADAAYVNVLALAVDASDFQSQIKEALSEIGLDLVLLEDVETMSRRLSKHSVSTNLSELADDVRRTGSLRFGTFHAFRSKGGSHNRETKPSGEKKRGKQNVHHQYPRRRGNDS